MKNFNIKNKDNKIPQGRLTVPYPAQKGAYGIPSRESQLPPGRVHYSGMS